jgi:hypothetical protein
MFRARPAGPASEVDRGDRQVRASRRRGRRETSGVGAFRQGAGLLVGVVGVLIARLIGRTYRYPLGRSSIGDQEQL